LGSTDSRSGRFGEGHGTGMENCRKKSKVRLQAVIVVVRRPL